MWKVLYSVLKSCCKFLPQHTKTAIAELFWIKCKTAVVGGKIALKVLGHEDLISVFAWKGMKTQPSCCKWNLSKKNVKSLLLCWAGPHTPCIFTDFGPEDPQLCIYMLGEWNPKWGRQSGLLPVILSLLLLQSWLPACLSAAELAPLVNC